tara:strand:- start:930 stop:1898 length:969 start_codon:yes stop_codon:yes gene_type:complete
MTNVSSDFNEMQSELKAALELLEKSSNSQALKIFEGSDDNEIDSPDSLLDRCNEVVESSQGKKVLRSLHHFACSGGSLISKCIDCMPSVRLLSELHPLAKKHLDTKSHKFTPSDVISCAHYANVSDIERLANNIMLNSVNLALEHASNRGEILVFREHTHTDFCVGDTEMALRFFQSFDKSVFVNLSVVTVRNPIDSYLSLRKNGWVHFSPDTFNEYCKRLNHFLSGFSDESVYFYEKFVENPCPTMKGICQALDIPYSDSFIDIFGARTITGDSGRGGSEIKFRPRRELSSEIKFEVENSEEFSVFLERFDFYKGCMENLK